MKILFLIGYSPKFEAKTWNEIVKHSRGHLAFDADFYQMIKALELNSEFENEILKARKKLNIPDEGYFWKKYEHMMDTQRADFTDHELKQIIDLIKHTPDEVGRITKSLKLNKRIIEQLKEIILTSTVSSPTYLSDIHYWLEPDDRFHLMDDDELEEAREYDKSFNIAFIRQVSKNELIKFIEEQWDYIEKQIKILPQKTSFHISPRDLRVVELRDIENLTFSQIANRISLEFQIDDPFGKVNEDSVKTAYRRTKIKIATLAEKQKRNK